MDRSTARTGTSAAGLVQKFEETEDAVAKVAEAVRTVAAATASTTSGQTGAQRSWQTLIAGTSVLIAGLSLSAVVLGLILP